MSDDNLVTKNVHVVVDSGAELVLFAKKAIRLLRDEVRVSESLVHTTVLQYTIYAATNSDDAIGRKCCSGASF